MDQIWHFTHGFVSVLHAFQNGLRGIEVISIFLKGKQSLNARA
jgi:hypothetical protein